MKIKLNNVNIERDQEAEAIVMKRFAKLQNERKRLIRSCINNDSFNLLIYIKNTCADIEKERNHKTPIIKESNSKVVSIESGIRERMIRRVGR